MARTVPISEVKTHLPALLTGVGEREEEIVVTRKGRPAAVLVNFAEYERLKATGPLASSASWRSDHDEASTTPSAQRDRRARTMIISVGLDTVGAAAGLDREPHAARGSKTTTAPAPPRAPVARSAGDARAGVGRG